MRKTCAKAVDDLRTNGGRVYNFCTTMGRVVANSEYKSEVMPRRLPTLSESLSTAKTDLFTSLSPVLCTVSTPLITTTTIFNKYLYSK